MREEYKVQYFSVMNHCWCNLRGTYKSLEEAKAFKEQYQSKHKRDKLRITKLVWVKKNEIIAEVVA